MKPTDPVAAPLLPLPCPFCGKEPKCTGHILRTGEPVFWCGCLTGYCETFDGVTTAAWNHRTPLPPRADWALEGAWEIEADQQFGRMELQRIKDRAAIIAKHAPAAPDAQDGERLDWYERNWEKVYQRVTYPGWWYWSNANQRPQDAPTLRAALDEARGQKE